MRKLPVTLALVACRAFVAHIFDGQKNGPVISARAMYLAGVDKHGAPPNSWEIMHDLELFYRRTVRNYILEQRVQCGDIPLPVSEFENTASLGLAPVGAKHLIENAIGGRDNQVSIENDEGAGDSLDDIARNHIEGSFVV
ncbi:MAG: hypothetical protein RB191_04785 [Terriglobia bacterium]|nr:hypothetical protein [Terriglobia bacterium]